MEKITITRVGPEKTIDYINKKTGKPDSFKKVGVQTNEYGERWMDIAFRGEVPVKVGQSYEGEITSREYTSGTGEQRTAYEFKLPQERRGGGGMSPEQHEGLMREIRAINANVLRVISFVDPEAKLTSAGKPVPDFSQVQVPGRVTDPGLDPDFDPFAGM